MINLFSFFDHMALKSQKRFVDEITKPSRAHRPSSWIEDLQQQHDGGDGDLLELGELVGELVDLQPGELDQAQRADRLGLHARERHAALAGREQLLGARDEPRRHDVDARVRRRNAERALHEPRDRLLARAAGADQADDLVDVADGVDQALELVRSLARLAELSGYSGPKDFRR